MFGGLTMSFSKTNQMIRHITLLLFIGLAWGQNKVNIKNLVQYGDKMFEQNEDKPYTGRVFDLSKSTGEKILDGWYRDGKKSGRWTYYTKKGNAKYKLTYEKGNIATGQYIDSLGNKYKGEFVSSKDEKEKNNGSFIIQNSYNYDFTIQPNKLISYKNGKEDGLLTTWYENGHKSSEGYMNEGIENGIWTFYYENGFEKYKIKYNNGIPFGELLWWTESGEKQKTDDFVTFYRKLYLHNDLLPIMRRLVSRKNDRSPKIQYQIGDIYLNDYKDYEKAIEEYQKVIRMFPGTSQEPESLFMIGYIYSNILNDLGSGMEIYKKFLKKFPKHELTPTVKFELEFLGVSIENIPDREIVTESKFSTHVDTKDSTTPAEKGGYGL